MSEALSWNLDDAFLVSGTGAGQPRSILNDPATIAVAKEAGQAAATVTYNNLCAMFARLHPASMSNSTWVINESLIPQLMTLSIAIGTAGQGQRAHWVAMARWAASAMLIYFVIESSVSSG
jgi:HK97 family phage major capsid protein